MSVPSSVVIGLMAGVLVVVSVLFFDRVRIDDPVGATSVHLANGVFGTIALGLFSDPTVAPSAAVAKKGLFLGGGMEQLGPQLLGVVTIAVLVVGLSVVFWYVTKLLTGGIRVSEEEEVDGLDIGEHGNSAYPDFQGSSVFGGTHPSGAARAHLPAPGAIASSTT